MKDGTVHCPSGFLCTTVEEVIVVSTRRNYFLVVVKLLPAQCEPKDGYVKTSPYRLGNGIRIQNTHDMGNDDTFTVQSIAHPNSRVTLFLRIRTFIDLSEPIYQ